MSTQEPNAPTKARRRFRRRVLLWAVIGAWCILTLWLSVLPREEIRVWETAIIRNEYFRRIFSRELLNWRPPLFAELMHLIFFLPFGVAAFVSGMLWGRSVRWRVLVGVLMWAALAEGSQFFVEGRTPRLLDLGAGWLGIALGFGGCVAITRTWRLVKTMCKSKDGA